MNQMSFWVHRFYDYFPSKVHRNVMDLDLFTKLELALSFNNLMESRED